MLITEIQSRVRKNGLTRIGVGLSLEKKTTKQAHKNPYKI